MPTSALRKPRIGPSTMLEAAHELAPVIAARADEIEAGRRVPLDLVERLTAIGCFRMLRPVSHGGFGFELVSALRVYEELSRADASVGWIVAIGSAGWLDLNGLPRPTFDEIFADDAEAIVAGAFNPTGNARPLDGGYRVSGRWSFASGCEHCHWIFANCVERSCAGGSEDDPPQLRIVVLRPDAVDIEDTWRVSGLRGTGSHHFTINDVFVPTDRSYALRTAQPSVDQPLTRIPIPSPQAMVLASIAIGIARGALDDILDLAGAKVPLFNRSALATNPLFQHQLGTADAQLRAARALLYGKAAAAWRAAVAGDSFNAYLRAGIRSAATWATTTATSVVDTAYTAGGGSALYDTSPLQRRLRDIHAVTQHFLVKPDTLTTAGALFAGQDIDVPIF